MVVAPDPPLPGAPLDGRLLTLGLLAGLGVAGVARGLGESTNGPAGGSANKPRGRRIKVANLPHDMRVLLDDFLHEVYWPKDRSDPPKLPDSLPVYLVPVESLYRQVQHDGWDDRGPKHVAKLRRAMRAALNLRPEDSPGTSEAHRTPAAIARAFLQLVPDERAGAAPGAMVTRIPPVVVRDGENFWDGRHRLFAAYHLGLTHLPAVDIEDFGGHSGSRSLTLTPSLVDERKSGAFIARSEFFDVGMSVVRFASTRAVALKATQEFVGTLKSWTKDSTMSVDPTAARDYLARRGVGDRDPAAYFDLVRVNRGVPRGAGNGQAMVDRVIAESENRKVRVILLVSKHFYGDPSPHAFWVKNGFETIHDGVDLLAPGWSRGEEPLGPGDVVLMGRVIGRAP